MTVTPLTRPRRMLTVPGVYAPQHDTHLLMRAISRAGIRPGASVLELGTGSGALAVHAAGLGAWVTAVDISRRAVWCARVNAALHRSRVTVRRGDLACLGVGGFDMVVSNPPYVPAPADLPPRRGRARAWDAGRDGRAVVDRVCATAGSLLRPGGALLMVHSGLCGIEATLQALGKAGLDAEVSDRELVPLGPVLRSRLPWLRSQGLMDEGQDKEELVVIHARRH
ncbi:HemK2/MTQ2 family protein methyltransferase [Streptomyces sp. NPDC059398]|uniref:HemK2/MTQ2 family protein methyltransferase n=1 Tax=Streptomyces sp. NPDC059398 TaxID=3346820 RepID=UPI0036C46769